MSIHSIHDGLRNHYQRCCTWSFPIETPSFFGRYMIYWPSQITPAHTSMLSRPNLPKRWGAPYKDLLRHTCWGSQRAEAMNRAAVKHGWEWWLAMANCGWSSRDMWYQGYCYHISRYKQKLNLWVSTEVVLAGLIKINNWESLLTSHHSKLGPGFFSMAEISSFWVHRGNPQPKRSGS